MPGSSTSDEYFPSDASSPQGKRTSTREDESGSDDGVRPAKKRKLTSDPEISHGMTSKLVKSRPSKYWVKKALNPGPSEYLVKKALNPGPSQYLTGRKAPPRVHDYLGLYNEQIEDLYQPLNLEEDTQITCTGVVTWTPQEKAEFFAALRKYGKDDLSAISGAVMTKSEPEVHEYIETLHTGMHNRFREIKDHEMLDFADHPTAIEIGPECERLLNGAAENLAMRQNTYESHVQSKTYGDIWLLGDGGEALLDQQIARAANDATLRLPNQDEVEAAAELLKAQGFVDLLTECFMNSRKMEENWRTIAARKETPAIHLTALLDFYNLVVTITKRILVSSLFYANSRIRAKNGVARHVRKQDVRAATDVLRLSKNRKSWGVGLVRRCKLRVYTVTRLHGRSLAGRKRMKGEKKLSYEEAETYLKSSKIGNVDTEALIAARTPTEEIEESEEDEGSDGSYNVESSEDEIEDPDFDHNDTSGIDTLVPSRRELIKLHEEYADAKDLQATREEELRFYEILGETPPEMDPLPPLPEKPMRSVNLDTDPINWRDTLQYQDPRDRYSELPTEQDFENSASHWRRQPVVDLSSSSGDDDSEGEEELQEDTEPSAPRTRAVSKGKGKAVRRIQGDASPISSDSNTDSEDEVKTEGGPIEGTSPDSECQ